jgi:hypothetical protein
MSTLVPKTYGMVTLRYVVLSALNRLGDFSYKQYKRLLQICTEGMTELSLWHLDSIEIVYLHMSVAKTVNLPADFVDYLKIGVPINGKIRVLTNKESILLPRLFDTGESVGNTDEGTSADDTSGYIFFGDHYRNGVFTGGLFGLPGGLDDCYYRIDRERRQIVFSGSTPRSEIVLEYISSGVRLDGATTVPREAVPALRTYIMWQMLEGTPRNRLDLAEMARRKQEYEEAVAALRSFQQTFTAEEYKKAIWSTSRQSPKR